MIGEVENEHDSPRSGQPVTPHHADRAAEADGWASTA